ncbi:MAG: dTDP-4-dehydrorhamnose 3,5-epimerase [Rhodospirillaceae bacterium]|jgi:dTDP-4-dehydrorhamnose 3,5-epimerase|nr:dTDP-4-dehydrorhamnose 3,5-epimerase [Rhodospirillaceae bacterium]MBT4220479.1 dTDP-4-dehydrorhamnose 3,5-epimerase [Rhodospirillaceae bacterium]MBT4464431.1 dTDP-4-dehydrorhamnose 3,5-epimerase [Rhodospirillaceae bacterium]MBT5308564.1 dTDP-4-dehydrorhamnose 3,5-epimerase [Rhodospirillaceae bacterium]MBT7356851.1 dTDP-4-dehydrorhamnose 3,5-epimerase [Rhodospirillaceae bacterium]
MDIEQTKIDGARIIKPDVFGDERGWFMEPYQTQRYFEAGITDEFVQDNLSHSKGGVLRGFHYQFNNPQSQLIYVSLGEIFFVLLDVRRGSPTFGEWVSTTLSADNYQQFYMTPGLASAFCVMSESANVHYKVNRLYEPSVEGGVLWSDPALGVDWPLEDPIVIKRDAGLPKLADISDDRLPPHRP